MRDITTPMRVWTIVLLISFLFGGFTAMFAQDLLASLFATKPLEPVFIRVAGALELTLAFMLYRVISIKKWDMVRPMVETIVLASLLLTFVGFYNFWVEGPGAYGEQAYIRWWIFYVPTTLITVFLYFKERNA